MIKREEIYPLFLAIFIFVGMLCASCSKKKEQVKRESPPTRYTATLYSRDGQVVNTWSNLNRYIVYSHGQTYRLYLDDGVSRENYIHITTGDGQMIVSPQK